MASWLTAQLKAAEGLLEAVDKTVSRTVGNLGLAEGDSEQLTPEYGVPISSANFLQGSSGAGAYQQPYNLVSAGPAAYSSLTANLTAPASAGGLANQYGNSAAATPWENRVAASSFSGASPSSSRSLTAADDSIVSGKAAGFTVKVDAPIPFGGPPGPTAAASTPEVSSGSGFSRTGAQQKWSFGEADAATPTSKHLAPPSSMTPGPVVPTAPGLLNNGSSLTMGLGGSGTAAATASDGPVAAGLVPGTAATQLPQPSARGVAAAPAVVAAPAGPMELGSTATLRVDGTGITETLTVSTQGEESPVAQSLPFSGSSQPGAPPTSALGRALEGALGAHAASSATGQTLSLGEPSLAPNSPALPSIAGATSGSLAAPGQQQQPQQQHEEVSGTGGGGSSPAPAPVAKLASATTAAASTLASATTTAVTHSLSFFNLVLDDQDTSADGGGPATASVSTGGGGAAQQIQFLSRTCEQLRKRLEASRAENEQLEDMLARAEVRAQQEAALVLALREELAGLQQTRAATESSLAAQLAVARSSLAEVSDKYEASQRTVLVLEGQLLALEESSRRLLEQHSDREGGMVEALSSELAAAEARLAAETKAYQASRAAAAAREQDLEHQIAGSTAALAEVTRSLEEANRKCRGLEEEMVSAVRGRNELSAQVAALQRQLEDAGIEVGQAGACLHGGARGAAAAAAAAAELDVLRSELEQHQRAAQLAKQAAEVSQAQAAALAQELEALRQSAEQRKDAIQLEAQLQEVSDMLYLKQTQMERLAAEKAAQQLKTERELESVRQELAKLSRHAVQQGSRGPTDVFGSGSSPHDVIPMDALGEPYQRLVRHNRVGRAVKAAANFLDSTASTTSFVLRQYPLARLAVFMYAVLIHLYVYFLIARMQRLATHYEAAAVAPTVT
ncbi:hypothetical protein Vretimale_3625 [Volvox reticuliferus]|uniref:Golgin-84 n=1 Tax=Volvox reticuliferus TaxID=1737510 RepID=A0A8J4DEV5_9CHLO|nr:hypothetical protein Vretifemale_1217 [Volvox reticuliferus]GIL98204.1 hypothetical protein Vretimale_3625 [Volvox reticuliferus]